MDGEQGQPWPPGPGATLTGRRPAQPLSSGLTDGLLRSERHRLAEVQHLPRSRRGLERLEGSGPEQDELGPWLQTQ